MAFPVTLNGRTYTLTDFEGTNYVDGLPDAFEDFVTHAGDIYNSTSTTSNSIGTGSKTFTVEANKPYQAGTPLRIADAAAPSTNFLDTVVTSYSGTTLVVNSIGFGGSGTKTSWTVNIGGAKTVDGTLGLSQGGTGATDAAGARTNIDVYSKADADSRFLNVSGEASDVTMNGNTTIGDSSTDTLTVRATTTFTNIGTGAAAGPYVNLFRDSSSPADDDFIGILSWQGKNDADQTVTYGQIAGRIADASDGSEDARIDLQAIVAGTTRSIMQYESGLTQFNAAGQDIDFKVHSTSHTDMFFLDANLSRIGIKTSSLSQELNIDGNFGFSEGSWIGHTDGSARIAFRDDNLGVTGNSMQIASSNDIVVATMSNAAGTGNIYFGSKALDPSEAGWQTNVVFGTEGNATFNENGNNADFRVKTDNSSQTFIVDGGSDTVNIGQSANFHGNRLNIEKSDSQTDGPEIVMKNLYQSSTGNDELGSLTFGGWRDVASTGSYVASIAAHDVSYPGTSGQLRFFTRGSGTTDPSAVRADAYEKMRISHNNVVVNETSNDTDFRIESDANANQFVVDAGQGMVGFGRSSPASANAGVKGIAIYDGASAGISIESGSANQRWMIWVNASDEMEWYNASTSSARMVLTTGGALKNTANSYGALSDQRIKQDIVAASSQWDDVKAIQVKNYRLIADVENQGDAAPNLLGVIAQDLEASGMGGLVDDGGRTVPDENGIITGPQESTKSVKYSILYMKAVKALQEAMDRIETLEARVAALESN